MIVIYIPNAFEQAHLRLRLAVDVVELSRERKDGQSVILKSDTSAKKTTEPINIFYTSNRIGKSMTEIIDDSIESPSNCRSELKLYKEYKLQLALFSY